MSRQFALVALVAAVTASHAQPEPQCDDDCVFTDCSKVDDLREQGKFDMFNNDACVKRDCTNKCTGVKCRYQWYSKNTDGNFLWNDEACASVTGCPDRCDKEVDCSKLDPNVQPRTCYVLNCYHGCKQEKSCQIWQKNEWGQFRVEECPYEFPKPEDIIANAGNVAAAFNQTITNVVCQGNDCMQFGSALVGEAALKFKGDTAMWFDNNGTVEARNTIKQFVNETLSSDPQSSVAAAAILTLNDNNQAWQAAGNVANNASKGAQNAPQDWWSAIITYVNDSIQASGAFGSNPGKTGFVQDAMAPQQP